jgi:ATP-binding cassette subfamily B (MDR/TAP) protein 1
MCAHPLFLYLSLRHQCNRLSLKQVGEGGSLAEEVFGTVRTTQAFGSQKILSGLYDAHMEQSFKYQLRSAIFNGGGLAVFYFVLYACYALSQSRNFIMISHLMILLIPAFSFGTTLINRGQGERMIILASLSFHLYHDMTFQLHPEPL